MPPAKKKTENTVRDGAHEDHEGVMDGAKQGPADGGQVEPDDDDNRDDDDDDD